METGRGVAKYKVNRKTPKKVIILIFSSLLCFVYLSSQNKILMKMGLNATKHVPNVTRRQMRTHVKRRGKTGSHQQRSWWWSWGQNCRVAGGETLVL